MNSKQLLLIVFAVTVFTSSYELGASVRARAAEINNRSAVDNSPAYNGSQEVPLTAAVGGYTKKPKPASSGGSRVSQLAANFGGQGRAPAPAPAPAPAKTSRKKKVARDAQTYAPNAGLTDDQVDAQIDGMFADDVVPAPASGVSKKKSKSWSALSAATQMGASRSRQGSPAVDPADDGFLEDDGSPFGQGGFGVDDQPDAPVRTAVGSAAPLSRKDPQIKSAVGALNVLITADLRSRGYGQDGNAQDPTKYIQSELFVTPLTGDIAGVDSVLQGLSDMVANAANQADAQATLSEYLNCVNMNNVKQTLANNSTVYQYFMGNTPQGKQTIAAFMRLGQGIYDMIQKNSTGAKKTTRTSRPRA